ncbi:hypothetical protein BC936DRAFT_138446 [Jimgerdemannia flammicorona]|uniref:Uncharacterized protein n=1 Tax=Jimgerdemannia flammicorona TaxID=994334 RepID=A0A433CFV0_9FUNG|nr:hypothetical protein BC936DRAFT_138446 [Jimgerdemannia flammicorona]
MKDKDKDPPYFPTHRYSSRFYFQRRGSLTHLLVAGLVLVFLYLFFLRNDPAPVTQALIASEHINVVDGSWNERSNWHRDQNEEIRSRRSVYTPDLFRSDALKTNGLIPVTAVLLSWKRPEGLKKVVQYLVRYPFIKEILIWNNNKKTRLNIRDFELNATTTAHVEITVFNSDENLHDLAKYTTCAIARHDYCYFQDDDWINLYLDSEYTNFLGFPDLIHSNTMPIIHLEHRRWQFTNPGLLCDLPFDRPFHPKLLSPRSPQILICTPASPGSAAAPSSPASRFSASSRSLARRAWARTACASPTCTSPFGQINTLTSSPTHSPRSIRRKAGATTSISGRLCIKICAKLYKALAANSIITRNDYFIREEEEPRPEYRDARAPCLNDRCLFLTNIDPFPHPLSVVFDNVNITHIKDQEALFNVLNFPSNDFWTKHAYHYAVDQNDNTCWNSYDAPRVGDYFGLHMVTPIISKRMTIVSSHDISGLESAFAISVSTNGKSWMACKNLPLPSNPTSNLAAAAAAADGHRLTIGFACPITEPFRMVRAEFQQDFVEPFEVCAIGLDGFAV